ncbi:type II secretion system F family protein [Micrococcoides hystricis]|uniref:Type II secretion system F family protein n=1 Tax=Micrococcoides hystricis TaxID=1572761 RepID=A0ABV6PAM4_9MICC
MMLGLLYGLMLGAGVYLVYMSCWPEESKQKTARRRQTRLRQQLAQAGLDRVTVTHVNVASVVLGLVAALIVLAFTGALPVAACFGVFAALLPRTLIGWQAQRRHQVMRGLWPDAVDHLRSATRAGLSLPEALIQLATHGPQELQPAFAEFARDYRSGYSFNEALARLQHRFADPIADRLCAALRLTREVGGTELGRLLATLARFLRDDARTRHELAARQSWTVNGARLAVSAPWIVLFLVCLQPAAAASYQSAQGALVVAAGVIVCVVCYRIMIRIGTLPEEERVLQQ